MLKGKLKIPLQSLLGDFFLFLNFKIRTCGSLPPFPYERWSIDGFAWRVQALVQYRIACKLVLLLMILGS